MSDDISKATVRGSAVFPSMRISGQARSGPLQIGGNADLKSDEAYEGPYEITPSTETQVLETARKKLAQNIVIDPVEAPTLQAKSVTPTESEQDITADVGYDGLEKVDVAAIASDYVGSAIDRRSGSDLSASGRTVTVPKGFYAAQQTKSVQQGTEGTPTATKSAVSNHAVTVTPSVTNQEGYIDGGTKNGSGVTVQASELVSGKKTISENGTDIDVTEYEKVDVQVPAGTPTLQTKSVTPTESAQEITADVGYDGLEEVDVAAIASDYVGSAIDRRSGSDLSASGQTVTVPKGFYAAQQTKSVQQGTEGTPTATKSAVSNHAVTVTPSVTNQEGYIAGGTKNGSGVTVQASELVSGKKTISENGTDIDVTEYEKVDVQVPGSGSSKNTQVVQGTTRTTSSTQTAIGAEMTVSKSGTYDIYWSAFRSNTSSSYTYGTQLYVGGAAYGSENTTWTNHVQNNHLTSVSLTAGQKLRVYGRNSRGSSYYIYAPTLVIVEN